MDFTNLKSLMEHFVNDGYAPGNTIRVYLKGKKVFDYTFGVSDIEKNLPMTGDEFFNIYSCSKIATVTAALQLVEKGLISLDAPLYDYISEYKEMYIKNEDGEITRAKNDIKVLNLFNMTAGLTYNIQSEGIEKARRLTNGKMDTSVVARCLADDPLSFEPGEKFRYSLCHDVLAGLVSIVSGKKFRDYVKENIFDPLDMRFSSYHLTPEIEKKMAAQYRFCADEQSETADIVAAQAHGASQKGTFQNVGIKNNFALGEEYDSGGAGIISTASDYIKLAAALSDYGIGLTGERILAPETVKRMRTNTLDENQIKTFSWKQLKGCGYGLGVRTMMDLSLAATRGNVGEFGWGGAAGASVYIDPELGLSALYLKHTLNPREGYYQPLIRDVLYSCL